MASIKFDTVEILNTTYIPRFVKHESAPERELSLLDLAREDGSILVAEKYGTKRIIFRGILTGATESALETAIDDFKELFSRKEKNLDISWAGTTRRYVATCIDHSFDRDHFNNLFVPWTAEFIVVKGIGEMISESTIFNNVSFTAASVSGSWAGQGSADPKPRWKVKCGVAATDPKGIEFRNTDNDERFVITRSAGFGAGKYFEMDCRLKTAKYDGEEIAFYGIFPTWIIGTNGYEIKIGDIVDQEFLDNIDDSYSDGIYAANYLAQGISVPYTDNTYQGITLRLKRFGVLVNDLTVEIWEDDGSGNPDSANKVANAVFTIAKGNLTTSFQWLTANSANAFTLNANTKYWIVLRTTAGDATHYYKWSGRDDIGATYKRGEAKNSVDSGVNWGVYSPTVNFGFKLLYGGKADAAKTYYHSAYYFRRYL